CSVVQARVDRVRGCWLIHSHPSFAFFLMVLRPPGSTQQPPLFPYTTLFRSVAFTSFSTASRTPAGPTEQFTPITSAPHSSRDRKSTRLNSSHRLLSRMPS